jgi:hypothetical protein
MKLLQEQTESSHHKTKSHQSEAGAKPGQNGPLSRKIIPQIGFALYLRCRVHCYG